MTSPPTLDPVPREADGFVRRALLTVGSALRGETGDLARGSLGRAIPLLAIPMVLETSMEALFSLADVIFVSRLGATAVAAVGLTEAMLALIYAAAFGLAMPATAVVARRVGEGEHDLAAQSAAQAIWLGAAVGGLIALTAPLASPLLSLMGATPAVLEGGRAFAALSLLSAPLIVLLFVHNGVLRGAGDANRAMRALWLANGLNLALDPCFIFGLGPFPEMGVTGAAVATLIGRATGVAYQLHHLRRGPAVSLQGHMALRSELAVPLLRRAWGGAMQHVVETGSWVVLTRLVASFGSAAVAGYTIAIRLVIFTLLPAWGLSNATATLVGQSLGAGDPHRAERAVWLSGLYAMGFLCVVALAFLLAPTRLASLITSEAEVITVASRAMFIIAFGYAFYGWQMVGQQAFNGAGDTLTPAWINACCFWLLQLPLAYLLSMPLGLGVDGVFVAVATCYTVAAAVSMGLVRKGSWKHVVV